MCAAASLKNCPFKSFLNFYHLELSSEFRQTCQVVVFCPVDAVTVVYHGRCLAASNPTSCKQLQDRSNFVWLTFVSTWFTTFHSFSYLKRSGIHVVFIAKKNCCWHWTIKWIYTIIIIKLYTAKGSGTINTTGVTNHLKHCFL